MNEKKLSLTVFGIIKKGLKEEAKEPGFDLDKAIDNKKTILLQMGYSSTDVEEKMTTLKEYFIKGKNKGNGIPFKYDVLIENPTKRKVIDRINGIIKTELKGKPFNFGTIVKYYLKKEFESQVTEEELENYCKEVLLDLAQKGIICGVSGGELPTGVFIYSEKTTQLGGRDDR